MLPRKLIYVYFVGVVFAIGWIYYNFGSGCQESGDDFELEKKKVQILQQKHESQKSEIEVLKRRVDEYKSELRKAEIRLSHLKNENSGLPKIFLITPTHMRPQQKAELTRLSYTLRLVPNVHWIVIEDAAAKTVLVSKFLTNCKVPYTHLNIATPGKLKLKESDPNWLKPRGVHQRNAGLDWIRKQPFTSGVVYFADDDNTYDIQLFEEMRFTEKVSVWPVGLVGYLWYESPVVKQGKVIGWYTFWKPERHFAMDMAGFAVNLRLFKDYPTAKFHDSAGRGNLESDLLTQLNVQLTDLEPKAEKCTKVLVWHTRTEKPSLKNEEKMMMKNGFNSENVLEV
ncbi:galactosylgalactosylxylosylprotein 3-beta-glucuronosyltransferase 3-like [Ruditapes philippinarum]|uniref:galactosylgalactosylxylosylprotein 3-beta-glucuronosyltransferase 3-like n=1 Tax=Ruditapes philippinarum TaxID=129788 RepID=UPI00295A9F35|nr:galactosylgalactosylxylosylprotein 3-beta-glucuronosyltransferase 3-like [Ruditapes philippinarum]XP_060562904.1 galactosylgalactosylxylosylprotein 3-beta-glucuronosyltransferase 3-like [Ruditapes philippinarum]